jgi:thiamine pyrophosphate-dependent acetolactate synthase large subunit-like protein
MNRSEFMLAFARHRDGAPAITGPGATSGTLWAVRHEPATIYNMEMTYATPMSLGVAMARPRQKVAALEGDGSAVAGMPVLATIGRYQPANLIVVFFDNRVYGTGGAKVETATAHGTDLVAVASSCGIEGAVRVTDLDGAEEALRQAFAEPGPWVIVADIDMSDSLSRPLPEQDHVETAQAYRAALADGPND